MKANANIPAKKGNPNPSITVYLSNTNIQVGNNNNGSINSTSMEECRIMQETISSQAETIRAQQSTINHLLTLIEKYYGL